jgi:hypothetical protein
LVLATGLALVLSDAGSVFAEATARPGAAGAPVAPAAAPGARGEAYERTVAPAGPQVLPDTVLVQVVDRSSGAPVPGAEVVADDPSFRSERLSAAERREHDRCFDPIAALQRWGQRATADADGFARLRAGAWITVHAQEGLRYGTLQVGGLPPADGYKLALERDLAVDVQVVDAHGAGLPSVPLSLSAEFVLPGANAGDHSSWAVAWTDAEGRARVRHLQLLAQDWQGRSPRGLRLFVGALGLTDVGAPVALGALPASPLVLALGPHGSVRVTVSDRSGSPVPDHAGTGVTLSMRGGEPARIADEVDMRDLTVGGVATFAYLGLGLGCEASAWLGGTSVARAFAGPTRDGEQVDDALSLDDGRAVCVRGRAVGRDGAPRAAVELVLDEPAHRESLGWTTTGADGSFAWYGESDVVARAAAVVVVERDDAGRPCASSAPLPLAAGAGGTDLGEVVLQELRTIARGRVTAWTSPLPRHTLRVETWLAGDGGGEGRWIGTDAFGVMQDADGTFAVTALGAIAAAPLRLSVDAPDCEPVTPFGFHAGRDDLLVELRPGAALEVRLLLGPALAQSAVELTCRLEARLLDLGPAQESVAQRRDGERAAEFTGLRPGDYRLTVSACGLTVIAVDGLRLAPGHNTDARLNPLDLRGRLHPARVRLHEADGAIADESAQLFAHDPATGSWRPAGAVEHGVALLAVVGAHLEIAVVGPALQPIHWQGQPGDVELRLQRPFAVAVECAGLPALPAGAPLSCVAAPVDGSPFLRNLGIDGDGGAGEPAPVVDGVAHCALREAALCEVSLVWLSPDAGVETLCSARCELSPAQSKAVLAVPADVQQLLRERLRAR